ncbi:MAG: ABC transporter ATP-binding protein [Alphaproteobacteria bacterium]|nr:ABC transporter ATP-binding protein [Alphaproteobacteria bacterium]
MSGAGLALVDLSKHFGGVIATDRLTWQIAAGELHALIGPNGAGKTTLLSQLSGELSPDAGRILFDGRDITALSADRRTLLGIGRSFQGTSLFAEFSVLDNVRLAVQARAGHSFRFWRAARQDAALNQAAFAQLREAGLDHRAQATAGSLSHGEQRQLDLAMALVGRPRLLLLDEPMAGLGAEESLAMVARLKALKGRHSIVLVEHDMTAVFELADRITVLVYGRAIATGTPADIRANAEVRAAYLGEAPPAGERHAGA